MSSPLLAALLLAANPAAAASAGATVDPEAAASLLYDTCAKGDAAACQQCFKLYKEGEGALKPNASRASRCSRKYVNILNRACKGDELAACAALAEHRVNSAAIGEQRRGINAATALCEQRFGPGCLIVGNAQWFGTALPEDKQQAMVLINKACDYGYLQGCAAKANYIKSEQSRCVANDLRACSTLGLLGLFEGIDKDGDLAAMLHNPKVTPAAVAALGLKLDPNQIPFDRLRLQIDDKQVAEGYITAEQDAQGRWLLRFFADRSAAPPLLTLQLPKLAASSGIELPRGDEGRWQAAQVQISYASETAAGRQTVVPAANAALYFELKEIEPPSGGKAGTLKARIAIASLLPDADQHSGKCSVLGSFIAEIPAATATAGAQHD